MAPLGYNPEGYERGEGGGRAEPGEYQFKVDDAEETQFKTGSHGLKVTLLVAAMADRDVQVFVNLVYTAKARWKLDQFITCIGLDFMRPPELRDLIGRHGKASFVQNDRKYLEVEAFLEPEAGAAAVPNGRHNYGPPPMDSDDVPF